MRFYLDVEFNNFGGELISLALVPEENIIEEFYEVVPCHNPCPWVKANVIPVLNKTPVSVDQARDALVNYLWRADKLRYPDPIHIVADWPEDIIQFNKLLLKGAGIMARVPTLLFEYAANIDKRMVISAIPHNSLEDARALKVYFENG